jgi:hypothetical protein
MPERPDNQVIAEIEAKSCRILFIVRHGYFVVCYFCMHPRNSEILGPVIRAFGKKQELSKERRPVSDASVSRQAPPPLQLSLLKRQ